MAGKFSGTGNELENLGLTVELDKYELRVDGPWDKVMISGAEKAVGLETLAVKGLENVEVFWSAKVEPYVVDVGSFIDAYVDDFGPLNDAYVDGFGLFNDAYVDDFGAVKVVDENARGVFRIVEYVVSYPLLVLVLYMGVLENSS